MSNRKKKIDLLRQLIREAKDKLQLMVQRAYPVGSLVTRGGGKVVCEVIQHGYEECVKVRNCYNNNEYWVDAYHFEN